VSRARYLSPFASGVKGLWDPTSVPGGGTPRADLGGYTARVVTCAQMRFPRTADVPLVRAADAALRSIEPWASR